MSRDETTDPPRVVIPGGSGFMGRSLSRSLIDHGYRTTILSRSTARPSDLHEDEQWLAWDARTLGDWSESLDGAAAVINLVGRSVDCRKTARNKRIIMSSRIDSCRALGEAMRAIKDPPAVWVQSSTAHIVGDPIPPDTLCDDNTPPGPQDELAPRVGVAWERAFDEARLPDQRGVAMRIGFVIGRGGGAMARLLPITRWGLGGTVGSGHQWMSWIHQNDLNRLFLKTIRDEGYRGVYMVTAPNPVTNREFMRTLRRACGRPWSPPAPSLGVRFASRFILNTDPELALLGRRCVPKRLIDEHGFEFDYPDLASALRELVGASPSTPTG